MEIWKDIDGYHGVYKVSNFGRIKSIAKTVITGAGGRIKRFFPEAIIKPYLNPKDQYLYVKLCRDGKYQSFKVHRLVGIAFKDNPLNLAEINHLNGDKVNNYASNLEWSTHIDNVRHAFRTGLVNHRGEKNAKSKFTWTQVRVIREAVKAGYLQKDIAKYFKVAHNTISTINSGRTWVES